MKMDQGEGERLVFDVETNGFLDVIDRIHCIVIQDLADGSFVRYNSQDPTGARGISRGLARLEIAKEIIGHNIIGFDLPAIKKVCPWFNTTAKIIDTLVLSRLIHTDMLGRDLSNPSNRVPKELLGRHSLEAWGHRLGEHKGESPVDWSRWSQDMEDYCVQDVAVNTALYKLQLGRKYSQVSMDLENSFADLMNKQTTHGFKFDVKAAEKLYVELLGKRIEAEAGLQEIFPPKEIKMKQPQYWFTQYVYEGKAHRIQESTKVDVGQALRDRGLKSSRYDIERGPVKVKLVPFNPGSTDQIAERLIKKYGWAPTEYTDADVPKVKVTEEILSNLKYPEIPALQLYLMVNKRISQLAEGKTAWLKLVTDQGRIHGRINTNGAVTGRCTHSGPNMANVPASYSPYGSNCRELFIPSKGMSLVGWDGSGLELRCLAHYMHAFDNGAYMKELLDGDIHTVNQLAAGLDTRDQAKTFIYAFLYGAGDEKIGSITGGGKKEGRSLKKKFLERTPALKKLKDAVEEASDKGYLIGLDKREIKIRSKHSALNALLQGCGAVVMKQACVNHYDLCIQAGLTWGVDFAFVGNIHDEIQTEAKDLTVADQVGKLGVKAIQMVTEQYNFRCPLDGEYKVGKSWAETH